MTDTCVNRKLIGERLRDFVQMESRPKVLIGFDGYVDKLVRPRKTQELDSTFESVAEFGQRLMEMGGTSSDTAVTRLYEKIGGNGPLLAEALAEKGVPCCCIGAMGFPELTPQYRPLAKKVELLSVAECAGSYVLEFPDGKIMLGDADSFLEIHWENICKIVGKEKLLNLFLDAQLVCFTNWSGLPLAQDILEGILTDICPKLPEGKKLSMFFDLADPSAKSEAQFEGLFDALRRLEPYYDRVVGLNPKECLQVWQHFYGKKAENFAPEMLTDLLRDFPADEIMIHDAGCSYAGRSGELPQRAVGRFLTRPAISVGAGDNFNSGYCLGKLCQLSPVECAALGNETAVCFMEQEAPMTLSQLLDAFE